MSSKLSKYILALVASIAIISCKKEKNNSLKLGVLPIPYINALNEYVKPVLEKDGIKLEIIEFSDYNTPNLALQDGSIDINAFQHQQFLDKFNETHNTNIVPIGVTTLSPIGFYSKTIHNIDELKDGSKIAIPNDPSNEGRVLLILQENGIIVLRDGVNINSLTPNDIIENPKNLQFSELDAAQLPRVIEDFSLVAMNGNFAINAGYDPTKDPIVIEDADTSQYVNIFAVKSGNEKDERFQKLIKAFQTKEVAEKILEEMKGAIIPTWEY